MPDAFGTELFWSILMRALPGIFVSAFMAILFLQSGLDKVFNYRDNLNYHREHFKNSPLAGSVGLMTPVITVLEVGAGLFSAVGCLLLLLGRGPAIAFYGQALAATALLALFFGQRVGKDYAGAASLVPYFLVALAGMWLLGGAGR